MNKTFRALKLIGYLFAGAVTGALIFLLAYACVIGVQDLNCFFRFVTVPSVIAGTLGAVAGGVFYFYPMQRRQRILLLVAIILWLPFLAIFGDALLYQPIKFGYLIRRIESAKTPDEERAAFTLAKRWGCCWEIHLEEPPKDWLDYRELDAVVKDPHRKLAVELEWLESKPNGIPYRARRMLTEKTNIYIFFAKDSKD